MSRDKPLWLGRGIKTATCQLLRFEDLHVLNQVVIWHSKAPKCWLQILSKWAVISHSDWGEASKLQYSRGAFFEDLHLPNQAAIWHPNAPKCWLQIPSKWAVISHSDRGAASKLQHFKCPKPQNASDSLFKPLWLGRGIKTATFQMLRFEDLHVFNQVVIWQSKAPKWWFQILSKWAVISHSDWGEASKRHQNCNTPEVLFLKTCICLIKLQYDTPTPQNADSRFSLNEPW